MNPVIEFTNQLEHERPKVLPLTFFEKPALFGLVRIINEFNRVYTNSITKETVEYSQNTIVVFNLLESFNSLLSSFQRLCLQEKIKQEVIGEQIIECLIAWDRHISLLNDGVLQSPYNNTNLKHRYFKFRITTQMIATFNKICMVTGLNFNKLMEKYNEQ